MRQQWELKPGPLALYRPTIGGLLATGLLLCGHASWAAWPRIMGMPLALWVIYSVSRHGWHNSRPKQKTEGTVHDRTSTPLRSVFSLQGLVRALSSICTAAEYILMGLAWSANK